MTNMFSISMKYELPQQLANEAQVYLLLCEGGLNLESELPAWADKWIASLPQSWSCEGLYELSTCHNMSLLDIWSQLRALGGLHTAKVVRVNFLAKLLAFLDDGTAPPYAIAHALESASVNLVESDGWPNFKADFMAMAHAPITEDAIIVHMRQWLTTRTREQPGTAGTV